MNRTIALFCCLLYFGSSSSAMHVTECKGKRNSEMMFSDSGLTGDPVLTFKVQKSSWSLMGKDKVRIFKDINGPAIWVTATGSNHRKPISLRFLLSHPQGRSAASSNRYYDITVYARYGKTPMALPMKCKTTDIAVWTANH